MSTSLYFPIASPCLYPYRYRPCVSSYLSPFLCKSTGCLQPSTVATVSPTFASLWQLPKVLRNGDPDVVSIFSCLISREELWFYVDSLENLRSFGFLERNVASKPLIHFVTKTKAVCEEFLERPHGDKGKLSNPTICECFEDSSNCICFSRSFVISFEFT